MIILYSQDLAIRNDFISHFLSDLGEAGKMEGVSGQIASWVVVIFQNNLLKIAETSYNYYAVTVIGQHLYVLQPEFVRHSRNFFTLLID